MTLKIVATDIDTQELKMPQVDRTQRELEAWKTLAIARGSMLDPLNSPESRSYAIAKLNALEALKTLRELNAR